MTWGKAGAILAVIVPILGASWYVFDQRALAQGTEKRVEAAEKKQRTVEEAVQKLTDIHVRQQTVADAEAEQIKRLCAAGKLKGDDCK